LGYQTAQIAEMGTQHQGVNYNQNGSQINKAMQQLPSFIRQSLDEAIKGRGCHEEKDDSGGKAHADRPEVLAGKKSQTLKALQLAEERKAGMKGAEIEDGYACGPPSS
jgi:hypothetical protein